MKMIVGGFIAALAFAPKADAKVMEQADRFTGKTILESVSDASKVGDGQSRMFMLHAEVADGALAKEKTRIGFAVISASGWQYLRCYELKWLVDGKPLDLSNVKRQGDTYKGSVVTEYVVATGLEADTIHKLAAAKSIEYRICNDEGTLSVAEMTDLREFDRRLAELLNGKH